MLDHAPCDTDALGFPSAARTAEKNAHGLQAWHLLAHVGVLPRTSALLVARGQELCHLASQQSQKVHLLLVVANVHRLLLPRTRPLELGFQEGLRRRHEIQVGRVGVSRQIASDTPRRKVPIVLLSFLLAFLPSEDLLLLLKRLFQERAETVVRKPPVVLPSHTRRRGRCRERVALLHQPHSLLEGLQVLCHLRRRRKLLAAGDTPHLVRSDANARLVQLPYLAPNRPRLPFIPAIIVVSFIPVVEPGLPAERVSLGDEVHAIWPLPYTLPGSCFRSELHVRRYFHRQVRHELGRAGLPTPHVLAIRSHVVFRILHVGHPAIDVFDGELLPRGLLQGPISLREHTLL